MAQGFTIYDLDVHRLCQEYSLDNLVKLWAGKKTLTLLEIFDLPIPDHDRIGVTFLKGMLEREKQNALIVKILTRHIQGIVTEDAEVQSWKTRWLDGTDRSQETAEHIAWITRGSDPKVSYIAKGAATAYERQVGKDPDKPDPDTREYRACKHLIEAVDDEATEWQTQVQEARAIINQIQEERS